MSRICFGCGAKLQYSNKDSKGYVPENKLNDDLRSKVNDNVKTITQTLTDTQKAQARQNIDVLEVTQQDIDNLPGGGLNPISDNTIPEVQGIETLLGFDVNGNIVISNKLSEEEQALLNIHDESRVKITSDKKAKYLQYHYKNIFENNH